MLEKIKLTTGVINKFIIIYMFIGGILGDDGKLYNGVSENTVVYMRQICSVADIVMPNYTEAVFLADMYQDRDEVTRDEAKKIVDALRNSASNSDVLKFSVILVPVSIAS